MKPLTENSEGDPLQGLEMMKSNQIVMIVCLLAWVSCDLAIAAAADSGGRSLAVRMHRAWEVSWQRFYLPKTKLFYDYLSSYEPSRELAHPPTADEVARQDPNECGYGTGMEDCMISAGVMLSLIVDGTRSRRTTCSAIAPQPCSRGFVEEWQPT